MKKTKKLANALIDLIHATYIATKEHSNGGGLLTQTVITMGNKNLAILKNTNLEVYDNETANHKHFKITEIEEAITELNNPKPIPHLGPLGSPWSSRLSRLENPTTQETHPQESQQSTAHEYNPATPSQDTH